jgi:LytS/YehU family sensor histidine kinase
VEQVRLGPRLSIENRIQQESETCRVPPLIVQPLVENAVHHGISHLVDGGRITIEARVTGRRLKIVISNPCDPDRPAARAKGIGQENVRHRLLASYGMDARLKVENAPDFYRAEISMPADTAGTATNAGTERKVKP